MASLFRVLAVVVVVAVVTTKVSADGCVSPTSSCGCCKNACWNGTTNSFWRSYRAVPSKKDVPLYNALMRRVQTAAMYNVFVYGTLKRGEPNHHLLENKQGAIFHSNATTIESYPLVVATKYNVPFLLDRPGQGNVVQGEVYQVTDSVLAELDDLEDHPVLYVRREEQVQLDNDERLTCWIYFLPRFRDEFMRLPFLKCYRNAEHPLKYVTRSDRTSAKSLHDFVLP